tara:strand:- start:5984 stop:6175 length:192 start_codon:yes stop_codon:yes gene_type:complete
MNDKVSIGNLVKVMLRDPQVGVIVNTWRNHKRQLQGVDVLLPSGEIKNVGSGAVRLIDEIDAI